MHNSSARPAAGRNFFAFDPSPERRRVRTDAASVYSSGLINVHCPNGKFPLQSNHLAPLICGLNALSASFQYFSQRYQRIKAEGMDVNDTFVWLRKTYNCTGDDAVDPDVAGIGVSNA